MKILCLHNRSRNQWVLGSSKTVKLLQVCKFLNVAYHIWNHHFLILTVIMMMLYCFISLTLYRRQIPLNELKFEVSMLESRSVWQSPKWDDITQFVKRHSALFGIERFVAVSTRAHHCVIRWARWIQSSHAVFLYHPKACFPNFMFRWPSILVQSCK